MCVSAEDPIDVPRLRIRERARSHLRFQAQPSRVQAIEKPRERLCPVIEFLDPCKQQLADPAYKRVVGHEPIELMSMDREMPFPLIFPDITLVNRDSDKVRHDLRQSLVMITFNPDDLDPALPVRELADLRKEHPMIAVEPREIEVREDVAEKNQPPIRARIKNCECLSRAADVRTEMYI